MQKNARPEPDMGELPVLVRAEGVGVKRDRRWLIRDIDLTVRRGEIVTLIGPNGGGKTTTAKALLGLIKPDAGTVWRDPALRVGYVPQRFPIDWTLPLTVSRLMSLARPYARADILAALAEVGAEHLVDSQIRNLSGGEFQRVLLARAIIGKPDLLVLDEPVQGVDYSGEIALYELIGRLHDRLSCGVLLISHDLHIVMAATDSVVCLDGHVCCHGPPSHVVNNQAYRQLFGARGSAALAVYRHEHDHQHDHAGNIVPLDGASTAQHDHGHHHGHTHDDHHHHHDPEGRSGRA